MHRLKKEVHFFTGFCTMILCYYLIRVWLTIIYYVCLLSFVEMIKQQNVYASRLWNYDCETVGWLDRVLMTKCVYELSLT